MHILYMLVLNNTPFVHARVYLQYLNNALPGISSSLIQIVGEKLRHLALTKIWRDTEDTTTLERDINPKPWR